MEKSSMRNLLLLAIFALHTSDGAYTCGAHSDTDNYCANRMSTVPFKESVADLQKRCDDTPGCKMIDYSPDYGHGHLCSNTAAFKTSCCGYYVCKNDAKTACDQLDARDLAGRTFQISNGNDDYKLIVGPGGRIEQITYSWWFRIPTTILVGYHQGYNGMTESFNNGKWCGGHGRRSAKITYVFGPSTRILSRAEPATCFYTFVVQIEQKICEEDDHEKKPTHECYHYTAEDNAKGLDEQQKCEQAGSNFIFSRGDVSKAPGCGQCWCCKPRAAEIVNGWTETCGVMCTPEGAWHSGADLEGAKAKCLADENCLGINDFKPSGGDLTFCNVGTTRKSSGGVCLHEPSVTAGLEYPDCTLGADPNAPWNKANRDKCRAFDKCYPKKKQTDDGTVVKVKTSQPPKVNCQMLAFATTGSGKKVDMSRAGCLDTAERCQSCFMEEFEKDNDLNASFWNGETCTAAVNKDAFNLTRKVTEGSQICKYKFRPEKNKPVVTCHHLMCSLYTKPFRCTKRAAKDGIECFWNAAENECQPRTPEEKCNLVRRHCNKHPDCKYYVQEKKCKDAVPVEGCGAYKKRTKCNNKSKGKCNWDPDLETPACVEADKIVFSCDKYNNKEQKCRTKGNGKCKYNYDNDKCVPTEDFTEGCDRFKGKRTCENKSDDACGWNKTTKKCVDINTLVECETFFQPGKCEKKSKGRCGWSVATGKCVNSDVVDQYVCDDKCCPISFKKLCSSAAGCSWNKILKAELATKDPSRGDRVMGVCQKSPGGN